MRTTRIAPALALLGLHAASAHSSRSSHETALADADVCESRTINYITHTLPQQCLRTSWTSPSPTANGTGTPYDGNITAHATVTATATSAGDSAGAPQDNGTAAQEQDAEEELAASSFMSFEEWKEMMLRKSGQDPASIKAHKQREQRERDPSTTNGDGDSFGEEGEISLDFDALAEKVSEIASPSQGTAVPDISQDAKEEPVLYDDGKTQYYRSKDAGKTCKERFSYASFDAGATVLKTSPGAKNAKAILLENKDSYMLLECRTKNKFVIVELSDDILVDTVVLANFEFFSSMIRKFRVSVSDRYPVKMEKWVDLGTFEARNSRDIQAFLIEHPQIYTKYIRVEFLSHWGNEFYCPVSLLRVHGTRMLDTWKEPNQDDEPELIDSPPQEMVVGVQEEQQVMTPANTSVVAEEERAPHALMETGLTPWDPVFQGNFSLEICALRSPTTAGPTPVESNSNEPLSKPAGAPDTVTPRPSAAPDADGLSQPNWVSSVEAASPPARASQAQTAVAVAPSAVPSPPPQAGNSSTASNPNQKQAEGRPDGADNPASATVTTSRNKTTSVSSSASPSPTVQESFFKTVTKRLQLLESNTSLSLQYIEEQSRFLQDVLLKLERKQITRVDSFLDTLNKTVLSELHNVRTQYDQIWQSTVIALETQREQSQREIVALTSRLNILADEVVFQKRMAIIQSVMLLCCLVLVIFTRGGLSAAIDTASFPAFPQTTTPYRRQGSSHEYGYSPENRPDSPSPIPDSSPPDHSGPSVNGNGPTALAASALPRHIYMTSFRDKTLPLTPPSEYSRESTPAAHRRTSPESHSSSFYEQAHTHAGEDAPLRQADLVSSGPQPGLQPRTVTSISESSSDPGTTLPSTEPEAEPRLSQLHSPELITRQGEGQFDDDEPPSPSPSPPPLERRQEPPASAAILRPRSIASSSHNLSPGGSLKKKPLPALPEDPS